MYPIFYLLKGDYIDPKDQPANQLVGLVPSLHGELRIKWLILKFLGAI